jgi:hypothetical protein
MKVLAAFEAVRSVYSHTIARVIRELRPGLEVRLCVLGELDRELGGFDPHLVVCSRPKHAHQGARGAWVHIPTQDGPGDEEALASICLEGGRWRTAGPPLSELLEVLDETRERLREGTLSEACRAASAKRSGGSDCPRGSDNHPKVP